MRAWDEMTDVFQDEEPTAEQQHDSEAMARWQEAQERVAQLEKLLCDLTPGGSEYVGNPERCAEWARSRMNDAMDRAIGVTILRSALEARVAELEKHHREAHRGMGTNQLLSTLQSENRMLAKKVVAAETRHQELDGQAAAMRQALKWLQEYVIMPLPKVWERVQQALSGAAGKEWISPDELERRHEATVARMERMEKALRFYADPRNHMEKSWQETAITPLLVASEIDLDLGNVARAALKKEE